MSEGFTDETVEFPIWLVKACKWCWHRRKFLFGTVILSGLLNLVDALPFVDYSSWHNFIIAGMVSRWYIFLSIFVILGVFTLLCGLVARLNAPYSERDLRRTYLSRVASERELATLQGIPAGLIAQSVRLADIFIPPQFRPNRPLVDFPLSEQELERYRQSLKRGDIHSTDLERVLFESEKNWLHVLLQGDRVGLAAVWKRLSTDHTVVLQGYPGMGKSTLMERLTLHMAMRGLRQPDPAMPEQKWLTPDLLPILLRLSEYAATRAQTATLSLNTYLMQILEARHLPGLSDFIQKAIRNGSCLVMLDGLDEVSDATMREQIQEQIKIFINDNFSNRFLITSRVAGYDQGAFPAYPHFILAELESKQIEDFLPRWHSANLARDRGISTIAASQDASIKQEINERVRALNAAIQDNPGVQKLAENPLLLTLLVVMQQNSVVLPRQRVELYDVVTRTLLENRNIAKHLKAVPEFQAIQRLGLLAFQMQETKSNFMRRREVEEELMQVIRLAGGTDAEVYTEAQTFLRHIRERGGLFALLVSDYFGFIHRTFQEYFAARFILNNIKSAQQEWIEKLVELACHQDALWREPFLLAVAYQSRENERIANAILYTLLEKDKGGTFEQKVYNLLLTVEAIIEAKELTVDAALQVQGAERLLSTYEQGQHMRAMETCQQIENIMQRWLLSLPKETYRPPLLAVIVQAISNHGDIDLQCAVLTLLANIASRLESCSTIVFETLIPLLLAVTGLPTVSPYSPSEHISSTTDFDVVDLAFSVLLFLHKRGLGGLYLSVVQQHFQTYPEQLRMLAYYSLECQTLITPTFLPLSQEKYQQYEVAIEEWAQLRDRSKQGIAITMQQIDDCQTIHWKLLNCAEEVNYPISVHLLAMLQRTAHQANQPWSQIWQNYLLEQINTGDYLSYQQVVFLWNVLFPDSQLQPLADSILQHYSTDNTIRQMYAQRLISSLDNYFLFIINVIKIDYLSENKIFKDYMHSILYLRYLRYSKYLVNVDQIRYLRYLLTKMSDFINISSINDFVILISFLDLNEFSNWRDVIDLSDILLNKNTQIIAREALKGAKKKQKIDLLLILEAWMLKFQVKKQSGLEIEKETRKIAEATFKGLTQGVDDEKVNLIALDVLSSLPARTSAEIILIRQIAEQTQDQRIQTACSSALKFARPLNAEGWQEIEKTQISPVKKLAEAAGEVMKRKS